MPVRRTPIPAALPAAQPPPCPAAQPPPLRPTRAARRFRRLEITLLLAVLSLTWPTRPAQAVAAPGDLVLNEIDYDQPGADTAEFIEIKNTTDAVIMLGPFDVLGINGNTDPGTEYMRVSLPDVALGPGEYFVIGDASVDNVDLVVSATSFVQNGAPDAVGLVESEPSSPANDVLIDSVSYEGDTTGGPVLGGLWTEGSGVGLDDSGVNANIGLSRLPDGVDTNANNLDLSQRCITPGAPNISASTECLPPESGTGTPSTDATLTPTPDPGTSSPTSEATSLPTRTPTGQAPTSTETPPSATGTPPETSSPTAVETETPTPDPPTATVSPTSDVPPQTSTPTSTLDAPPQTSTPTSTLDAPTPTPAGSPAPSETPAASPTASPTDLVAPPAASATTDPGSLEVGLRSLSAARLSSTVVVQWTTAWEISNAGFVLYRVSEGTRVLLTDRIVPARGNELSGAAYILIDAAPPVGKTSYWLLDIDASGRRTLHGPAVVTERPIHSDPQEVQQ